MTPEKWALWLALAALIIGAGKFLDDYHISKATKDSTRSVLVRMFVWLDDRTIPDLSRPILASIRNFFTAPLGRIIVAGTILSYWLTLSALYIGRSLFGPPYVRGYISYLFGGWISNSGYWHLMVPLAASIAVPAMVGLTFIAYLFRKASLARHQPSRMAFLLLGVIGSVCISLVGYYLANLYDIFCHCVQYSNLMVLAVASLASVLAPVTFATLTILLIVCRWCLRLTQLILLQVFNVASSPDKSPFIYASSLLSVLMLGAKVLQELVSSI